MGLLVVTTPAVAESEGEVSEKSWLAYRCKCIQCGRFCSDIRGVFEYETDAYIAGPYLKKVEGTCCKCGRVEVAGDWATGDFDEEAN